MWVRNLLYALRSNAGARRMKSLLCTVTSLHITFEGKTRVQVTKKTGNGGNEFDPDQWLSEGRTKVQINNAHGNLSFGAGSRRCVGRHLAMVQIVTMTVVVARHVRRVEMAPEERDRTFYSIGHPTDMPLRLVAR